MKRPWILPILFAALITPLHGCAPPLLVAGAAAGAAVATDKRAPRTVLEDQSIELKVAGAVNSNEALSSNAHVSATSYNHVVLLTGQTPTEALRSEAAAAARKVEKVRKIHNHIEIGPPTSLRQRSRDTLTTAKVKSMLLGEEGLPAVHTKVVTENDVVYLMGLVTRDAADQIARVVQRIDGVKRVVKVFEYIE